MTRQSVMRKAVYGFVLGLLVPAGPSAAQSISATSTSIGIGGSEQLAFSASGGQAVSGLEFNIQINDGGADLGGTSTAPTIKSVDLINGTAFANGTNPTQTDVVSDPLARQSTVDIADTVPAAGTIAVVTLDTTGLTLGERFTVSLTNVAGSDTTFFDANGIGSPISPTSISVTVVESTSTAVPISSPAGLAALGVVLLGVGLVVVKRQARRHAQSTT